MGDFVKLQTTNLINESIDKETKIIVLPLHL